MIDISIVVAAYNAEKYIDATIACILKQTFRNFEAIFIDDGSTDKTGDILDAYAQEDARINVVHQQNTGQAVARNHGIECAKGRYLLLLDADDILEYNMLESLFHAAERYQADITIGKSLDFDEKTELRRKDCYAVNTMMCCANRLVLGEEIADYIFNFSVGWAWDKLYRLDFVRQHKLQFPKLSHSEDLVFVFGAYCYQPRITIVDEVLVYHRTNTGCSVSTTRANAPLLFIKSVEMLKEMMISQNVEQLFQRSFVNWVLQFFYWHLDTIDKHHKKKVEKAILHYFRKNHFYIYPVEYFYNSSHYTRMRNMKYLFYQDKYTINTRRIRILGIEVYKEHRSETTVDYSFCGIKVYVSKRAHS